MEMILNLFWFIMFFFMAWMMCMAERWHREHYGEYSFTGLFLMFVFLILAIAPGCNPL